MTGSPGTAPSLLFTILVALGGLPGVQVSARTVTSADDLPRLDLTAREPTAGVIADGAPVVSSPGLAMRGDLFNGPAVGVSYTLEVRRGGTHHVDMRGHGFDAYLVLRDAEGAVVAEDDDGLAWRHARLVVDLEPEHTYRLEACALRDGRGSFDLELHRGEPDPDSIVEWTEGEIEARIRSIFPDPEAIKVVESGRYIVFTDSSVGAKFGKILDKEIWKGFFDHYDVDAPRHTRLLPIYLFNTREGYIDFQMRIFGKSRAVAEKSGGVAYRDFYATSYASPRDPVHFHECAHQIMANVLGLSGCGSWYQEGVATYYEDAVRRFNRFAETRMMIKTGQVLGLRELLTAPSMLYSAGENLRGSGGARGNYGQAASVIQFLAEGPWKADFDQALRRLGRLPRGDVDAVEAVFLELYEADIDDLEAAWVDWYTG